MSAVWNGVERRPSSASRLERDPPRHRGPPSGGAVDLHRAFERGEPVGDPLQAGPVAGPGRVEANPIVANLEPEHALTVRQDEFRAGGVRVLRDVL